MILPKFWSFLTIQVEVCSSKFQIGDSFSHFSLHTNSYCFSTRYLYLTPVLSVEQTMLYSSHWEQFAHQSVIHMHLLSLVFVTLMVIAINQYSQLKWLKDQMLHKQQYKFKIVM